MSAESCSLCGRDGIELTFHHLIPRAVHRRNRFKRLFSREQMKEGILVCRKCHSGIHDLHEEKVLALELNTLEKLRRDPAIAKHARWVAKLR